MLTLEGNIVTNKGIFRKRIEIGDDGIINKIGEPAGNADFVFKDEIIFPGFIDLHVHAREDQSQTQNYKEDFATAGQAAIAGGVVAFGDIPNNAKNPNPPTNDANYLAKEELTAKCSVPVLSYANIAPGTAPLKKKVPYKVFMGHSVGGLFFHSFAELEETLKNYSGKHISFHAEDPEILEKNKNQPTHELQRPPEAEISGIEFALQMIEKYKIFGKICHVSTIEGLNKIIVAKEKGIPVTAEVTPHHLYFDEDMIASNRKFMQVNPPVRQTKENRLALIAALKRGDIDYLASDHAPHTVEEKEQGASGLPHLDTYGPFTTWLMREHGFSPEEVARACAETPGEFFWEFTRQKYGKIEEGYVGSFTVIDSGKSVKITRAILKTKCAWSPFEGVVFPGSVAMTIIKGKVYKNNA